MWSVKETDSVAIEAFKVIIAILLTIIAIVVGIKLAWRLFWYLFLEDNNFFRELAGLPKYTAERSSSPPPANASPFRSLPASPVHSRKNSRHFSTHSTSYNKIPFGNTGDFRAKRKGSTASSVDSADIDSYAHRRSASSGRLSSIYGGRGVKHARGLSYAAGDTLKFEDNYLEE
ncbi:9550_t:CDS:2 [Paraglomus brasilianum]|uniref:9550_t:CDS:1 n=1 Tax=Paraglomus brasilianum TaxID=144538 RepID=A0A9N8WF69_9GLOM|nr:9550_t:CDS:2 [Paraglomus brasilianum]